MSAKPQVPYHQMNVEIDYTNWRGERRKRVISPMKLTWGFTEWHPANQWLLLAMDCEDRKTKEFAMKDIHSWQPVEKVKD